jgi:hypothetical protein
MDSIVNYGKPENEKKKTRQLAEYSRTTIFDFDYPLSTNVNRADFEKQILNHFIMRRLGFDTPTAFEIALENKLNEIMPKYNKMFDMMNSWNVFTDGESITREQETTSNLTNESETSSSGTSDRRYSETPQNELSNVRDGKYITDYNYDTDTRTGTDSSESNGAGTLSETINRTISNKVDSYLKFEKIDNIMSQIYKDLDVLFYGLL